MDVYQCKAALLPGSNYQRAIKNARAEYHAIQKLTPRREPYIRSSYFNKDKVFINQYWAHIGQKTRADGLRRVKLFASAIELIRHSRFDPEVTQHMNKRGESLCRFTGKTADGVLFYVQVTINLRTGRKHFMSAFPAPKQR